MKKLLLAVPFAAVVMLGSCGQQKKDTAGDAVKTGTTEMTAPDQIPSAVESATDFTSKVAEVADPDSLEAMAAEAQAYAEKLASEGKVDSARKYLETVVPALEEKNPTLADRFRKIKVKIVETYDTVAGKTGVIADSIASKSTTVFNNTKQAVGSVAGDVKDRTVEVAGNVGHAVQGAAETAGEKVGDVAREGADKVKGLFHKKKKE